MSKFYLTAAFTLCLTGCYTVNNERFLARVGLIVQPGISMVAAVRVLEGDGFECGPTLPGASKTCSKMRQRLIPSTWIERVNLLVAGDQATVARVDVPQIVCAGL